MGPTSPSDADFEERAFAHSELAAFGLAARFESGEQSYFESCGYVRVRSPKASSNARQA
jgi:hypothetical protein